jgi:hypothetical protein
MTGMPRTTHQLYRQGASPPFLNGRMESFRSITYACLLSSS